MGVDYRAVCFLGWEVVPEPNDAEPSSGGNGDNGSDYVEDLAKKHDLEWDKYGDGCYGGEDSYFIGYALHSQCTAELEAIIEKLRKHKLFAENGPPRVWTGVYMY